jgi:two-component system sensor histidine kinase CpxA
MSANGLGFAHNFDPQSPQATLGAPWAVTHNANGFPANGLPGKSVMVGHGFAGFPNRFLLHTANPDRFWLIVRIPLINPQMKTIVPGAVIACTNNLWQTNLLFDLRPALLIVTAILAFSILFWLPFAYRLSRELSNLNKATQRIAEGRFDTRVKANNLDEFGSLGQSVNGMAERLNAFVSQEKRFLGDIAHELGSPIARLQVALELLQTAAPDSRERIVTDIKEDVDEMAALVNELLDFSKAGLSGKTTELTTVDIRSLLTQIVEKMGAQKLIRLDLMKTKTVLGDETLLARAFANILRNAVTYAADYGIIHVRSDVDGEQLIVVVADSGPGVPSDTVLQLTQPFFRPESSRTRTTGGAGLGLAIVQSCVHACQGELAIRNRVPTGLEVEVRLCLASA